MKILVFVVVALIAIGAFMNFGGSDDGNTPAVSSADAELENVQAIVEEGYGDQANRIVRDTSCVRKDAEHFSCDVEYETAEGTQGVAVVSVTCDADRCVWRG